MINSRVSQITAALSGAAMMSLTALGVLAIDGQLNVSRAQSEAPAPRRLLPRIPVVPERLPKKAEPAPVTPAPEIRSGIEVNQLQGPDPQDFGTINALTGGLARNMWDGTSAALAAHLLGQIPAAIESRTLREMLRRMLLTAGTPPAAGPGEQAINLAALRVSQLQAMGLLRAAKALLDAAPKRNTDSVLQRLHAENSLMRHDIAGACAETKRPGTNLAARYWQQLLIFCHVAENNLAEASLGASLLAEGAEPADPVFILLVDGFVGGGTPKIDALDQPTSLLLAMLRYAKQPVPASALATTSPPLLAMIAASPESNLDLRLSAAEKAVRTGAMSTDRLTGIYLKAPFSGEDLDTALSTAQAARSPRGRALLYRVASGHNVPTARAEVLQRALDFAAEDDVYPLSTRLYQSMLEAMVPSVELSWFAADAVRALSALGRSDLARPWVNGLRYQSVRDPAAKFALDSLWPMTTLAGVPDETVIAVGSLEDWRAALAAVAPESSKARVKDGMALLDIAGHQFEPAQWTAALSGFETVSTRLPDYAYRAALRRAAAAGRLAETILLSSIVAGRDGLATLDVSLLAEVVDALRKVGLEKDAHALVLEAAVRRGI